MVKATTQLQFFVLLLSGKTRSHRSPQTWLIIYMQISIKCQAQMCDHDLHEMPMLRHLYKTYVVSNSSRLRVNSFQAELVWLRSQNRNIH